MLRWIAITLSAAALAFDVSAAEAESLKVVVVLDNSGSMSERMPGGKTRIAAAKQALLTVLSQTPADAEVGVLLLNAGRGGPWLVPLGPVDQKSMRATVSQLRNGGPTPLGGALKSAADALLSARDKNRYGTYKLLIVTDGEATDADLLRRYLPEVQSRGLLVDVIGVAMANQHSLATRANTYRSADNPASLQQAVSAVVLGESNVDAAAAGDSDFELLQGLPNEVAAAALTALSTRPNSPIGQLGPTAADGTFQTQPLIKTQPAGGAGQPQPGNGGGGVSFGYIILGAIVLFAIRAIASVGKGS